MNYFALAFLLFTMIPAMLMFILAMPFVFIGFIGKKVMTFAVYVMEAVEKELKKLSRKF